MQNELEKARSEWDDVAEIVPTFQGERDEDRPKEITSKDIYREVPLVTTEDILKDFRENYLERLVETEDEAIPLRDGRSQIRRWASFLRCSSAGPCRSRFPGNLASEKTEIMAASRCPFDDENPVHFGVLLTLYKQLTNGRMDCPRYGSHWESIGFQGNDPATDLRGVGFLGLIQAVYLTMTPELVPLARNIYRLSIHETQNFPLLVLSINVTRISLHALRDGLLDKLAIQDDSVWSAINYFYVAVLYHIYKIWKDQHKTIKDSGYVLKDAELFCRAKVKQVVSNLNQNIVTAFSVQEKQVERQNIQNRIRKIRDEDI